MAAPAPQHVQQQASRMKSDEETAVTMLATVKWTEVKPQKTCVSELLTNIPAAAQRLWTSAQQLGGVQLCSILNAAIRSQDGTQCSHAATIARAINELVVARRTGGPQPPFPPDARTSWRSRRSSTRSSRR